jgi:hypothetical protein
MRRLILTLFLPLTCLAQNAYLGSCQDFQQYIKDVGVTDANGKNWQGRDGVTLHKYDFVDIAFTNQKESESPHGYQCFSATATVSLKVTNTTSTMSWIPTPSPSEQCSCKNQIDKWQELLKEHEATHARLSDELIAKLNNSLSNFPVKGCTNSKGRVTGEDVRDIFVRQINAEIEKQRKLEAARQKKLDKDDAINLPSCLQCAPYTTRQQTNCAEHCPPGQTLSGGQCDTPCGPYLSNGSWQNCGFTNTQQSVEYCPMSIGGTQTFVRSPYRTSVCEKQ